MTRKTLSSLTALLFLLPVACGGGDFEAPQGNAGGSAGAAGDTSGGNGGTGGTSPGGANTGGAAGTRNGGTAGMTTGGSGGEATGGTGGAQLIDCTGQVDGTPCEGEGDNTLCIGELCVQSTCGDNYVDEDADEFCDDGKNGDDTDGCTDECKATCSADTDCDDGNPCNGTETCNDNHVCESGSAVNCDDGNPCTTDMCVMSDGSCTYQGLDDGMSCGAGKICLSTSCKTSTCGDHWVDLGAGEECDDGKDGDQKDGCTDDCKYTCKTNAECDDGNACTNDVCNTTTHTCTSTDISSSCNDGDECTADSCNPLSGCENKFIDDDGDGFSPKNCVSTGSHSGKGNDCNDKDANVFPGQTAWFTQQAVGGGWDYDCSSKVEKHWETKRGTNSCSGWTGTLATCGVTATYSTAAAQFGTCVCPGGGTCLESRTQGCH